MLKYCLNVIIIVIILVGLSGCNSFNNTEVIATYTYTSKITAPNKGIVETPKLKSSDLFEDIYVLYENHEMPSTFNTVEEFTKDIDYEVEILKPTDEIIGTVKLYDENGDYVYFSFKESKDIYAIVTVGFYQASTNSEVSIDNFNSDTFKYYTHIIGENNKEVIGIDEQREFLSN